MDCSPPGSSVHQISQARILEWVSISFSMASSWCRDWTHVSCTRRQILYHWATWQAPHYPLPLHKLDSGLSLYPQRYGSQNWTQPSFLLSPLSSSVYTARDAVWDHIRLGAAILTWDCTETSAKTFFMQNLFILHPSLFRFTSGGFVYPFTCFWWFEP